ncbi:hypothetical protein D8Y23_14020 [Microbacterium enclense]|uniref:Uncharacterized protein n=1 Tax=Microbacterium enclense TaxID=993073 RepID=A0A3S3MA41_9MICO|nr:hypothetical protein [Microbacterium enclense]RWR16198.1 hypothetical protein D8Y23_14020 [Microbacterium enclense]
MASTGTEHKPFLLAVDDPFLSALIGTIEEPQGTTTAVRAGQLTMEWWDRFGNGPSCVQLLGAVFSMTDWETVIDDPDRPLAHRQAQRDLLQQWLISYWARLGTIVFVPGHDRVVRPGRIAPDLQC